MNEKTKKIVKQIFIPAVTLGIALTLSSGCSRREGGTGSEQRLITIKGSDTMVYLASSWAETFMKQNPDIEESATGGGYGRGMAAILNGTTDICAAPRKIQDT